MNIAISPISIVNIISISTAFMLGLLFLTLKTKNNKSNMFLGLFLWSLSIEVLLSFLDGQEIEFPPFLQTGTMTIPFLLFYVIKTLNYRLHLLYLLLFIPFFLQTLDAPFFISEYIFHLIILGYILILITRHRKQLGDYYSNIDNKTLAWIKTIVYIYMFFNFFWILEDLIEIKYDGITYYFAAISTFLTMVMIYWIGFNGFSQPEIFNTSIVVTKEESKGRIDQAFNEEITVKQKERDKKTEELSLEVFEEINQKIRKNKLFLQKNITVRSLSKQLKINEKELSRLIKTHTEKNFYHYLNQFRVGEFKRLLQTEKVNQFSLLGLSKEAGFFSKSTFYSVFKSSEGVSPKQYLDQLNKSE
ncbi:helix-turn-helix domain-containing protein [Tenacibaculum sp. nBUS_03]|uniref:helix-turn-helix domain-containing protein n=1 Tax=Tenacibaculum sp. nBUS_03 TaxID=3395320 RepID=UPI003EBB3829